MKTGKDLQLTPIKPTNHFSNVALDLLLDAINDELYFFAYLPYNPKVYDYIKEKIIEIGKKINEVNISIANSGQIIKKKEILAKLREYYSILKNYYPEESDDEKVCRFLTAMYLKDKEKYPKDKVCLEWLQKTKKVSLFYNTNKTFQDINQECLNFFKITPELKLVQE